MAGRIKGRCFTIAAAAAAAFAAFAPPAAAEDDAVKALQKRVDELEAKMAAGGGASAGSDASVTDALKKGIPTKKNSLIKFYGFLRLDVIFDDSAPNNTQTIGWVKSEDPTAPGGVQQNNESLTIHPRLTRFGFDLDGGKVAALKEAKVTGKLEVDFYNNGLAGQSESRSALRMRHAYLDLDWGNDALRAGQTSDLISPLWPVVNPDMINWGAGNLGDRRPQVRWTHTMAQGESKFTAAGMVGLTGAVDNQNLDGPADTVRDGEESAMPTLQARFAYAFPMGKAKAEAGVWGDFARESTTAKFAGEDEFESAVLGIDLNLPVNEKVYVKLEAWRGRNLDDVRGGIFQGVNTTTGNEIHSQGGWVEAGYQVTKTMLVAAGYSEDNPDGGDLNAGNRNKNTVGYAAVHFNYDPVEFGFDFMNWHTEFKGQKGGLDHRFQAYIQYSF
jgi:hypothetical protein